MRAFIGKARIPALVMNFFLGGGGVVWPGSPDLWFIFFRHYDFCLSCYSRMIWHYCFCYFHVIWHYCFGYLMLLLLVILLLPLWFDIICTSCYVRYDWAEYAVIALSYLLLVVTKFTATSMLWFLLCDDFSEMPKKCRSCVHSVAHLVFNKM